MDDFIVKCHLCDKIIMQKHSEDGIWGMLNLDESKHEHLSISVSIILADIHYKDNEDKSKLIGDMTLNELEDRIKRLSSQQAAMKLASFLHAINGFISKGFKQDFIRKVLLLKIKNILLQIV